MATHDVAPPDPHGPPELHGPGDDLPPLDPRAVRHVEAALEELAGTAHPTAAGWDDVARRTQRRRRAQRRTQVAVAAAAVAEKLLREKTTATDHAALVDTFIQDVESAARGRAGVACCLLVACRAATPGR